MFRINSFLVGLMLVGASLLIDGEALGEDGRVLYLHFDEGKGDIVKDDSGNNNNGKIYGATWTKGKFGSALSFDGDDYIEISHSESLNIKDEISIELWFKVDDYQKHGYAELLSKGTYENYVVLFPEKKRSDQHYARLHKEVKSGDNRMYEGSEQYRVEFGKWMHIAYVFDKKESHFYGNGECLSSHANPYFSLQTSSSQLYIGKKFTGLIDEVRLYSRALTQAEVKTHYQGRQLNFVDKNLIPGDTSFETGRGFWFDGAEEIKIDDNTSFHGNRSLKVAPNWFSWSGVYHMYEIKPYLLEVRSDKKYTFSFYTKGESGSKLKILIMRWPGHTTLLCPNITPGESWKRYSYSFTPKVSGPISISFWTKDGTGAAWIDAIQLEEGRLTKYKPSEEVSVGIETNIYGNIFYSGESLPFKFSIYNSTLEKKDLMLSYIITDYYKEKLISGEEKITIKPNSLFSKNIKLSLKKKGFFLLSYELIWNGKKIQKGKRSFGIVFPPVKLDKKEEPFFGVQNNITVATEVSVRIGVKCFKELWGWSTDWRRFDKLIEECDKFGIKHIIVHIHPGSRGCTKKDVMEKFPFDEYGNYIYQLVSRYKDRIKNWELIGEPDLVLRPFGEEKVKFYVELLKRTYTAVKKADPTCKIEACGISSFSWGGPAFSEEVFKLASDYFDVFSPHPYCHPLLFSPYSSPVTAEDGKLRENLEKAKEMVKKYGKGKKVQIGELGWQLDATVPPDSDSEKRYADCIAKSLILARSVPEIDRYSHFATLDMRRKSFGLFGQGCQPHIAAIAYATCAQFLTNITERQILNLGKNLKGYGFVEKDKGSLIILWAFNKGEFTFNINPKLVQILDLMGNPVRYNKIGKEKIALQLSSSPIFFLSKRLPLKQFSRILESSYYCASKPMGIIPYSQNISEISALLVNNTSKKIKGRLNLSAPFNIINPEISFTVLPLQENIVKFYLKKPDISFINNSNIKITAQLPEKKIEAKSHLEFIPCLKATRPIVADANLKEWDELTPLKLDSTDYVHPDLRRFWKGVDDLSGEVYTGWDDKYFYFAAKVKDNIYVNKYNGARIWDGDSIQMGFDMENDAFLNKLALIKGYSKNDYEYTFAFTSKGPELFCHIADGKRIDYTDPEKIKILIKEAFFSIQREEGYLIYELALPFSSLGISPKRGKIFRFNFTLNDDDGQGMNQWMGLTLGIVKGKDPTRFKQFVLW